MRLNRLKVAAAAVLVASTLAACGDAGNDDDKGIDVDVKKDAASQFDEGTRMRELADAGKRSEEHTSELQSH